MEEEIEEKIEETIENKIDEVIETIEEIKSPEPSAQNLELGILVGQMTARLEVLENDNKILSDKIANLDFAVINNNGEISNIYSRLTALEIGQIDIVEEILETQDEKQDEITGDLIEIEIPSEPEKPVETKTKKRHFI